MWKGRVEQEILVEGGRKKVQAVWGRKGKWDHLRNRCKEMRTKREGAEKMLEKAFHEKTGWEDKEENKGEEVVLRQCPKIYYTQNGNSLLHLKLI